MADNRRSPTCFALELCGWAYGVHRLVKHRKAPLEMRYRVGLVYGCRHRWLDRMR